MAFMQAFLSRARRVPSADNDCKSIVAECHSCLSKDPVLFDVMDGDGKPSQIAIKGRRLTWALDQLINEGSSGCSAFDHWAPRWSSYIADLRGRGLRISTIRDYHEGPFPGWHARYVLISRVRRATP